MRTDLRLQDWTKVHYRVEGLHSPPGQQQTLLINCYGVHRYLPRLEKTLQIHLRIQKSPTTRMSPGLKTMSLRPETMPSRSDCSDGYFGGNTMGLMTTRPQTSRGAAEGEEAVTQSLRTIL